MAPFDSLFNNLFIVKELSKSNGAMTSSIKENILKILSQKKVDIEVKSIRILDIVKFAEGLP